MSKEHDHIDDLFREAFNDMESNPGDQLWDKISDGISEEQVDDLFKEALGSQMAQPSEKVWKEVEQNLPLNLELKRSLSYLSYVAAFTVIGMLCMSVYFFVTEEKKETPTPEPSVNIAIAIDEVETPVIPDESVVSEEEKIDGSLATDNTLNEKIQSVELNKEDEFVFDVDEDKIRQILEPLSPLPIDSAIARVNGNTSTQKENTEGIIIPENFDETILPLDDSFE